jgi:uncharacterized RDD family membrane protein YckC
MKKAPIFVRFLALSVDMSILSVICFILSFFTGAGYLAGTETVSFSRVLTVSKIYFFSSLFIFLFYFTYLNMHGGTTIGKRMFGIRVIRRGGMGLGMELGFSRALVRSLGYLVSALPFGIGFLMAYLLDGLALHDIIAGTQVIKEEG